MAVAVFAESDGGSYKKSSFEAVSYAKELANNLSTSCIAISINGDTQVNLGKYGADKELRISSSSLERFNPKAYAKVIAEALEACGAHTLVISQTYSGKSMAPIVAVMRDSALATGVISMADSSNGFVVQKTCFSNKAFSKVELKGDKRVLTLIPNSYEISGMGSDADIESFESSVSDADNNSSSIALHKQSGKIALTEAELVVSAGRGLKGPENWNMIEELADTIGAATACSKPVSDMEWRPHSEHVGQTGITIKPNLYIAIGISGAIQHLAGVSSSKVICVVNTDPEAPFFKAADYGIVGDAFEVVPKLINRAKEVLA